MNARSILRDHRREQALYRLRLVLLAVFFGLLLLALAGRMFWLQVMQHERFMTLAERNRIAVLPIPPGRGMIFDRNGVVLAHNFSTYTLEINTAEVEDVDALIDHLSTVVEISPRDRQRFRRERAESRRFESVPIRNHLSEEEVALLAVSGHRFPGAEVRARLYRSYPLGESAAHVVGYIGRINENDIERLEEQDRLADYHGTDSIGKAGVERSHEELLHGTTGMEEVEIDASGRLVRVLSRTPPVSGANLVLSLDAGLQAVAEAAIGEERGALVAIDPGNGQVLAMVSQPSFDPNLFVDGIDVATWNALNNSPDHPMNNRAILGQYPPGSTIKPFMALIGLITGTRTPQQSFRDPGFYSLPGSRHRYRDWKPQGHGIVNMFKSIVVSCDTYYYAMAVDLGIDTMHDWLLRFGFSQRTGIDLVGERPGLIPSRAWKRRRYGKSWLPGETVIAGIGQGYTLTTPLQLAHATATLANRGRGFRPRLAWAVEPPGGGPAQPLPPEPLEPLPFSEAQLRLVHDAMKAVMEPGGTARAAGEGADYGIAGKTGTAQVIGIKQNERYVESRIAKRHRDHALFVAWAPAEAPRIALAVVVENGGHGGATAAPIARKVFDHYLLPGTADAGPAPTPSPAPATARPRRSATTP